MDGMHEHLRISQMNLRASGEKNYISKSNGFSASLAENDFALSATLVLIRKKEEIAFSSCKLEVSQ